jgi:tripartite-type tricarboxylate transporter receptor subunit TctC
LHLAAGTAALPAVSRMAWAQAYPTRPVRVIVGQAAGSGSDTAARLIGQFLSERLGQQFVIENRPGAAGNLATEAVVRAPPDGYTLLLANGANTINATLYDRLNFDFIRDIAPINRLATFSFVMEVNPSVPARSLLEFIAYANSLPHIRAGKLRPLAVTTATRLEALPDVPTVGDFVPGYEASSWLGFGAPKNTPAAVIDLLSKEINLAISHSSIKARLVDLGGSLLPPSSPAEFKTFLASDTEKWARVIRTANIKPE